MEGKERVLEWTRENPNYRQTENKFLFKHVGEGMILVGLFFNDSKYGDHEKWVKYMRFNLNSGNPVMEQSSPIMKFAQKDYRRTPDYFFSLYLKTGEKQQRGAEYQLEEFNGWFDLENLIKMPIDNS